MNAVVRMTWNDRAKMKKMNLSTLALESLVSTQRAETREIPGNIMKLRSPRPGTPGRGVGGEGQCERHSTCLFKAAFILGNAEFGVGG